MEAGSKGQVANPRNRRSKKTAPGKARLMIELMRTNDPVVISFAEALLRDAGIAFLVADQNMSILEGSIGILPKRVLVEADDEERARRLLSDAGIADEMRPR